MYLYEDGKSADVSIWLDFMSKYTELFEQPIEKTPSTNGLSKVLEHYTYFLIRNCKLEV